MAQVSTEACAMFCASLSEHTAKEKRYRLDYVIGSRSWDQPLAAGSLLPAATLVGDCTAIGYTAKGYERWSTLDQMHIECVGMPPYPNSPIPRVVGMLMPARAPALEARGITEVSGNALSPRGKGKKLIVHIVNDSTPNWGGGGFAQAVRSRWPATQEDFKSWIAADRTALSLGKVRITNIDEQTAIASMICQKGYGPSTRPRIRYAALRECLVAVAARAANEGMSVHMPRIGSGQAGGSWDIIRELITSSLCGANIPVTVYDLPNAKRPHPVQQSLRLTTA
jgi:O-acetyl-ADP-ribose deacetylase (regulator of RNase III)